MICPVNPLNVLLFDSDPRPLYSAILGQIRNGKYDSEALFFKTVGHHVLTSQLETVLNSDIAQEK